MKLKQLYFYLIFILVGIGCQKVIEFNGEITEPLVVVNSLVTPDSIVSAQVSLSRFFLSSQSTFNLIDTANVALYVNGVLKETLTNKSNGVYIGTYKPLVNDSVSLMVQVAGKKAVSCGSTILSKVSIISVDTSSILTGNNIPIVSYTVSGTGASIPDTIGYTKERKLSFVLNFSDNAAARNYYRLSLTNKTTSGSKVSYSYSFNFDDIVSGNNNQDNVGPPTSLVSNKFNVFNDDLFNAKQYPLKFSMTYSKNVYLPGHSKSQPAREVYINLQSISRSYYLYLQTRAGIKTNTFFAEPVQVYTNVDGGTGIMGSYTSNVVKFTL